MLGYTPFSIAGGDHKETDGVVECLEIEERENGDLFVVLHFSKIQDREATIRAPITPEAASSIRSS